MSPVIKLLKATRGKQQITCKGTPIRLSADFSTETLQARREWHDVFKVMKEKKLQPGMFYPARLSFRFDEEIKSFPNKLKSRGSSTSKPALQQMLKEHKRKKHLQKINQKQENDNRIISSVQSLSHVQLL